MAKISIKCPICDENGNIEVSETSFKDIMGGLLAVNIGKKIICPHEFIAYIDKNMIFRDAFKTDFKLKIPKIAISKDSKGSKERKLTSEDLDTLYLIRLNISTDLLTYILKSIFLKKKIILIHEQSFLKKPLIDFFDFVTKNSFETDILLISKEDYIKKAEAFSKDCMVFENNKILKNPRNLLVPKKLKMERKIILQFYLDHNYGLIYLKDEVQKAYQIAEKVAKSIQNTKKHEKASIFKITRNIEKIYDVKIDITYLNFLSDIVKHYFKTNVPKIMTSFMTLI